ncbi:MAG TPA: ABC transporter ATP-binding protein [Nitrososphaerales archaeon]|nr:ABC transporter ATP-binding protein [Nitrososphaerales archaeon]
MCATVIDFSNATKDYGSTKRIGPVSFSIDQGEVVGFLGPNGSGKTTCIRLLLGLMKPTSGTVRIRGIDPISQHANALKKVGYSPELPNIQTFLTPRELLTLVANELSVPASETRREIEQIMDLVGLTDYIDVKVSKFSKGMVQRLSIAQGMMGSPDVLVMDEPMIGLDPAGSAHFREVFRDFAKQRGGTIFLSSHIMQEVESLCTSAIMIHKGKVLFSGATDDIIGKVLGSNYLVLEADPLDENLINQISKITGIEEVIRKSPAETRIELKIERGKEVRPVVAETVMKAGSKLYSMSYSENLLERTYIEALRQGTAVD